MLPIGARMTKNMTDNILLLGKECYKINGLLPSYLLMAAHLALS